LVFLLLLTLKQSQALRVVECPEFRAIILLTNGNIRDADIPRRTKVREAVLVAWNRWFQEFKKELQVSLALLDCHTQPTNRHQLGVLWARQLHIGRMDRQTTTAIIYMYHRPLGGVSSSNKGAAAS
jgi:hypothetical protein